MKKYKKIFKEEQYYYNYRRSNKELDEEIIFCSKNSEDSKHYGNIQRIFKATSKTDKNLKEIIQHAKNFYNTTEEDAKNLVNPAHIVSNAGAWDDIDFINYLYEYTNYFDKHDGIITKDGAVFFEINKNNLIAVNYL